jgi:uncharacterized protein (TIGR02466 family)
MIHQLFPTLIYQRQALSKKTKLFRELLKESQIFYRTDQAGLLWSKTNYPFGYTSYGSLNALHRISPNFASLAKILDLELAKYLKSLQFDIRLRHLKLKNLWLNVMEQGANHPWHIHPHHVISGSFYLVTPTGGEARIKFQDPRLGHFMNRPLIKSTASAGLHNFIELKVKPGEVVLFESWLFHAVPSQIQKSPRISVSFNYDWV